MNATTVGVDLAKNVFVGCVADAVGRVIETREFNRAGFLAWLSTLPQGTVVGMEACGGAHCWGRTMQALGLEPCLMAAEFVRAYRKRQAVKNDRPDAAAIVAALRAPGMRFIPIKTEVQQQRLAWHSLRLGWIEERTGCGRDKGKTVHIPRKPLFYNKDYGFICAGINQISRLPSRKHMI